MILREIVHTGSNPRVARAAGASIGGDVAAHFTGVAPDGAQFGETDSPSRPRVSLARLRRANLRLNYRPGFMTAVVRFALSVPTPSSSPQFWSCSLE